MIDRPRDRHPVELLADEFASRCRHGECPSVSAYAAEYPQYADQIEELFPAIAMLEELRSDERAKREFAARRCKSVVPDRVGDFEIIREIGRGGMGVVYEARQRSLGRRVAVKVLPKHPLLLERHLQRFRREAQTAARLQHTNIVPVFGVGDHDGLHYYVMPLVRGVGLDEIIRELRRDDEDPIARPTRHGGAENSIDLRSIVTDLTARRLTKPKPFTGQTPSIPDQTMNALQGQQDDPANLDRGALCKTHWHTVAEIGVQAAGALHYAHARGTLHRDIKPSNLLVDEHGVVLVADFGLARAIDETGESCNDEVVGTPRYMAPEQLRGTADKRSDIFALGMTLYEFLTLRPAVDNADGERFLTGEQSLVPVPLRKIDRTVPRDLETIILKCTSHDPSKRYQSANALGADLKRLLEDKPIRARSVPLIERAWRWCRRNPALAAMSTLAAALLIAITATVLASCVQTRSAYADAKAALTRTEATSRLALEALDDIYLQLSPDRVWISSDSDPGGDACACIGLRSGATLMSSGGRPMMQLQASPETALLLENLLVFYDRLAEQVSNDCHVRLESAIAARRVGDIRQRLGQTDRAEREYRKAIDRLEALRKFSGADMRICTELARTYNEMGNVRSAKADLHGAYESHQNALAVLEPAGQVAESSDDCGYELARTYYFLASKQVPGADDQRLQESVKHATGLSRRHFETSRYRKSAIRILEELAAKNPRAPDYRFLLALCHRPPGLVPASASNSKDAQGRQRTIQILEGLKAEYPAVVDYRYELAVTYAWVHVGLFPWQGPSVVPSEAERTLLKALQEAQWLVDHNPTIPLYPISKALILAKLGTLCRRTQRLAEAEDFFKRALETQSAAIAESPDLPAYHRVVLEYFRLRLGQVHYQRNAHVLAELGTTRDLLESCIDSLTQLRTTRGLADDRLAQSSLAIAADVLGRVLADLDEAE
jgi:serine/threonine protein kinase/tetratricopeptide (TPR) repeat protein